MIIANQTQIDAYIFNMDYNRLRLREIISSDYLEIALSLRSLAMAAFFSFMARSL